MRDRVKTRALRGRLRIASCALVLAAVVPGRGLPAQVSFPPYLELRVPKPPTVATGNGGSFLAYELHVTNFGTSPMTLKRVEVASAGGERRVLLAVADSALTRSIRRPGIDATAAERTTLSGGTRAVVHLWVPVDPRAAPSTVLHRLTIEEGSGDSARTKTLDGAAVAVTPSSAAIGPPLRGGVWFAANGPANESGHRRALIPVGGTPAIAQRFAIDYVKVGDDHRTFSGDSLSNADYHAEDEDALAVADGIVVAVKDGIPENIPGRTSRAVPITLETVGGNHVILDIGGGRYAFYAHLRPGSLRVRLGERVRRGEVIGLVGNSGNSTEPHLHFHLSDGNSPLGSEGVPYAHESFVLVGRCESFGAGCERTAPEARRGEMPMANMLVRFPD